MTRSFAQNAIAVLIDLAESGEIDPWDVQVIEVFDRVLQELALANQQDLSRSGQAFLYAAMLVLLKSDSLVEPLEPEAATELEELLLEGEELLPHELPLRLERHLQRRAVAPPPQRRRVTLSELIQQLEFIAATIETNAKTRQPRRSPKPSRSQTTKAIAELAHHENLAEIASELEHLLAQLWSPNPPPQEWVDLEYLLEFKNDRVGVFWALLFLSAQSKVELSQSEFYRDLKLRPLFPETGDASPT